MNRKMRMMLMGMVAAVSGFLPLAGCSDAGHARYTPNQDEARSSLEAALTAWRDGRPFGPIEATPAIRVADSLWQGGEQIESFQIGDEEDPGDGTKQFSVKLTIKKTKKVQDVRYVAYGRDPVWIFSAADYQKMLNMDNGSEPVKPKPVRGRSGRR